MLQFSATQSVAPRQPQSSCPSAAPARGAAPGTALPLRSRSCSDTIGRTRAYTAASAKQQGSLGAMGGEGSGSGGGRQRRRRRRLHKGARPLLTAPVQL